MQTKSSSKALVAAEVLIGVVVLASTAFFAFGGFYLTVLRPDRAPVVASEIRMQQLSDSLARNAEQEFEATARTGSAQDICRAATRVAEAYQHADREDQYAQWSALATQRCGEAAAP